MATVLCIAPMRIAQTSVALRTFYETARAAQSRLTTSGHGTFFGMEHVA